MFMPISSCDENRLQLAQEAQLKLKNARELAKTDDNAAALECYLFAFDNGLAVDGWGGVRLSYIPSEIAQLGDKYSPAKLALQIRRDAREELIRGGEKDFNVVMEWLCLNGYLHDKERELVLLNELQGEGKLDDSVKDRIIDSNFERLLEDQRYDVLSKYLDGFGHKFMYQIFHHEEAALFPKKYKTNDESVSMSDYWKRHISDEGAKVFELALGVKRELQADEVAKRILLHCNDAYSYARLIFAADRARQKTKVRELRKQAKANLSQEEYAKFKSGSF
jgi:hypothetical protein